MRAWRLGSSSHTFGRELGNCLVIVGGNETGTGIHVDYDLEIAFINAQLNSSRKDIRAQATLLLAPPPPPPAKMPADILINWVQNSYTLTSDSPFFSYLQTTPDVVLDARTTDALLIQLPLWTTNISHFSAKPLEILLQILATQTAEPTAALQALHQYDWQIDGRFGSLYAHLDQTKKILRWRSELTKELAH